MSERNLVALSHGSGSSSPITRHQHKGSIKAPAFALPLASRTGSPTHTQEVGFPGHPGTPISPASRTDCVGSVCNLQSARCRLARSMILDRLRLLHALSLSAPATACHAPSTEGACPRLTSSQRLDSAWGSFDYHRRCARCTQHAPTHPRGAESEGLVDLQIKPPRTQITFAWWPIPCQSPPRGRGRLPPAQWFRAGKAPLWHEEIGNQCPHPESSHCGRPCPSRFLQVSGDQSPTVFNSFGPYFTTCISLMSEMRERCTRTPSLLETVIQVVPAHVALWSPFSAPSLAVRNRCIVGDKAHRSLARLEPSRSWCGPYFLLLVPCTGECPVAAEMVLCNACYRHSHRVPPNTSWTSAEVPVVTTRSVGARGSWKSKRRPTVLHRQEQSPPRLSSGAGPRQHGMGSGLHVAGECARTGRFPVISHPHHPHTHRNCALSFAELSPPRYLSILRGSMSLAKSAASAPTTASSRCTVRPLWVPEAGM